MSSLRHPALIAGLLFPAVSSGQDTLFNQSFRNGVLPAGWSSTGVNYVTTSGGYALFTAASSELVTDTLDLSGYAFAQLHFSVAKYGAGGDGPLTISVSGDGGLTWNAQTFNSSVPADQNYIDDVVTIIATGAGVMIRFDRSASASQKRLRDVSLVAYNTPLPVTWHSFSVTGIGNDALLHWSTGMEQNCSHYEVERSADARAYEQVGRLEAFNVGHGAEYTFKDEYPFDVPVYYRLKAVDVDGRFSYSRVVRFGGKKDEQVIKPVATLAGDHLPLRLKDLGKPVEVRVHNFGGATLLKQSLPPGNTTYRLDTRQLPAGHYLLQVSGEGIAEYFRFVKQ